MRAFDGLYPKGGGDELRRGLLDDLEAKAQERLTHLLSDATMSKTRTAMRALAIFHLHTRRKLFKTPAFDGDLSVSIYNEWTLILFAEWMVVRPSPRLGVPVQAATICEYISCIKGHLETLYGFALTVASAKRLLKVLKQMKRHEPVCSRSKRRGLRGRHLRRAWAGLSTRPRRGTDRDSLNDWAALTTAWMCLARGGELCIPKRRDVRFSSGRGGRYVTIWLTPLKKKAGKHTAPVPIVIAEHDGGGSDCYAAIRRLFESDDQPDDAPLFSCRARGGKRVPMTAEYFRALVKDIARGLRFAVGEFAGHSCRIGGATDLADQHASPLLLQAKGRWSGDIARIYSRMTRRSQLAASRLMQGSGGRDCEEIFPTYTQAA